ncbi:MAG: hypothetical protein JWR59_618 [Brevundimonas sp.]|nr:hypothetical protein [Brevundimonas sp.]
MALTKSTAIANAQLDCYESVVGTSAILKIRSGAAPATVATASSGTVLATCNLPADWMSAAASRSKAKLGTWEDTSADGTGTAGHFEITASDGTTVGMRGSVTLTAGGGDMTVDSVSFTAGQAFSVTGFTITSGS